LDYKISGLPDNHHIKRPLSSTLDDALIPVYRQVCTTLWGGLQRIFNQISYILVKPMFNSGMRPLAKAEFEVLMRL
tara:strand:- start:30 stop:257 length:228 start_codon:yes stop_codon:yes gene_type:complete